MPQALPARPTSPAFERSTTVDALASPVAKDLRLNPYIRVTSYLAGRRDAARLEWTLEHATTDEAVAWHWLERNQRDFLQKAQSVRSRAEHGTAPANRELRGISKRVETSRVDVDRLRDHLAALENRAPIVASEIDRAVGEIGAPQELVLARRQRNRAAEIAEARRRYDAARLQLARDEVRIAELTAAIRLAARKAVGEVARLRAHFSRRAEVAARGVTHRSLLSANALGLLNGVATLLPPAWVDRLEADLLADRLDGGAEVHA